MALDPIAGVTWCKRYSAGNRSILEDVPVGPTPTKPEYLYAWTDPNPDPGEVLYAWTCSEVGMDYFYYNLNGQLVILPDNTIYTKTSVIDTSATVFYLSDGTEVPFINLHDAMYDGEGVSSADSSQISILFSY